MAGAARGRGRAGRLEVYYGGMAKLKVLRQARLCVSFVCIVVWLFIPLGVAQAADGWS